MLPSLIVMFAILVASLTYFWGTMLKSMFIIIFNLFHFKTCCMLLKLQKSKLMYAYMGFQIVFLEAKCISPVQKTNTFDNLNMNEF